MTEPRINKGTDLYGDYVRIITGPFKDTWRKYGTRWSRADRDHWTSRVFSEGDSYHLNILNDFDPNIGESQ